MKTLALGVVGQPVEEAGERVVHTAELSYFSRMSEAKAFEKQALVEIHERGVEKAEVVCAVSDGAEWIQKFVDLHRADAVRILDFAHAAEKVSEVGKAIEEQGLVLTFLDQKYEDSRAKPKKPRHSTSAPTGESSRAKQTRHPAAGSQSQVRLEGWVEWQKEALKKGNAALVLQEIERLVSLMQEAGHPKTAETMAKCLHYLQDRQSMIAYALFRERGYPIGSGSVESANKLVVESRMKGAGMRWGEDHVDSILALRNAACSDRWRPTWKQIRQQWMQQAQAQRAVTSLERRLSQPPPLELLPEGQTLSQPVPSKSSILPEQACPLARGTLACSPTPSGLPSAESSSSAHLSPALSSATDRRPAPTHPWRRAFLRQRPAC